MRLLFTLFIAFIFVTGLYSQESSNSNANGIENWEVFDFEKDRDVEALILNRKSDFGLGEKDALILQKQSTDNLGIQHFKYQQYYDGIKVEGGEYQFHISDEKMWGNGRLVFKLETDVQASINEKDALQKALAYFDADKYYWEDESKEQLIKRITDNPDATFYPKGELVLGQREYTQNGQAYNLLWKFEIYGFNEKMKEYVYVNALSGEIQYTMSGVHTEATEATAITRYSGEQMIITDSISSNQFVLIDPTRGGGIETYNLQESTDFDDAVNFEDTDNYWNNVNAEMDDAATDLHWGSEMTYDYYLSKHGRDSYDDNGAPIITYAHFGVNYHNAAWLGIFGFFGDGDDNPWVTLDIVGHEITHGVTKTTAGLIFYYESAALNESFSDIFGASIEFFADPDSADWQQGRLNFIHRDMSDPNSHNDPDTYLGNYWVTGSSDYGGAHTNSGVQNYWYYLLSEGGSGVNDNGDSYLVDGIGIDDAASIAYRNLTVYLTSTSQYYDARQGAIQSAIDLFGDCSDEVLQVIKAWHAVGLGGDSISTDLELLSVLSPLNDCVLSSEENVEISVKNNASGCSSTLIAGTAIELSYQLNEEVPIIESYVLSEDLNEGDVFSFTFSQSISLPIIAEEYELDVFVSFASDDFEENNSIIDYEVERKYNHGEYTMGFENSSTSIDSFYVHVGNHAQARISTSAENTGNRGFLMTARNTSGYLSNFADDPANNFEQNPEHISKICFCVDAQEWDNVSLYYDMKQTHSLFYKDSWGNDSTEYASSMRMVINGVQFEEQFHPDTYSDDPYLSYSYNLNQLAGTYFEFCFESKNYLNGGNDPISGSPGDNTLLDNIHFVNENFVSIDEVKELDLRLYPNPSNGIFHLESENSLEGFVEIMDLQGRVVFKKEVESNPTITLDLSQLVSGVYSLYLHTSEGEYISKIVIQK